MASMTHDIPFIKMHGLGNDFVIIDRTALSMTISSSLIQAICNRHTGIGCDQLVTIEPATNPDASIWVRFYNNDGSKSGACGNATRCVAHLYIQKLQKSQIILQTDERLLRCAIDGDQVAVNMGGATLDWQSIPLSKKVDTLHIHDSDINDGVAVNVGNPHLVLFTSSLETIDIQHLGANLEQHPLFPERANINFAQVLDRHHVKLRVWERGTGETLACGTGACATAVAAYQRGLTGHHVRVDLPGGTLTIDVQDIKNIHMIGPVTYVFEGVFTPENLQ